MAQVKKIDEKSCGVVLFRGRSGNGISPDRKYLILHYPGGHFDLPKGHVEETDKDEHATASRELKEETGISEIKFIDGFREPIHYKYRKNGKPSFKQVIFFLAETKTEQVKISFEHKNFFWLTYREAVNKLTFDNAKNLLIKAEKLLSK